jgi:hypothetical protein
MSGPPADDVGHGTHTSGIVGAVGNNGLGVTGVAWQVQLMELKFIERRLRHDLRRAALHRVRASPTR